MEPHDLRRHLSPPLFSDPEPLPEYLTRSSSDSSAVTVEDTSKDFSSHSAPAPLLDQSTRWTDQQHSLYIRSLETSFVNELHRSMRLRIWSIKNSTDEACQYRILRNSHNMPKQTLALQDACQKRINLERISPLFESTADSHILTGSQFELASVDRGCSLGEPINCKHGLLCDQEIHARGSSTLELACSTTEVTDQNFKDEEAKSSCMPLVKRLKKAAADGSSSDQSVPFGKLHTPDVSISSNGTSENRGHELLSELPESISQSLICRTFLGEGERICNTLNHQLLQWMLIQIERTDNLHGAFQELVSTSVKKNQTLQQLYSCGILRWLGYPWVFDVT